MILTCPECTTNYAIPDGAIDADGRKVKCKKCAHVWFTTAADLSNPTEPGPDTEENHQDKNTSPTADMTEGENDAGPFDEAVAAFKDEMESDIPAPTLREEDGSDEPPAFVDSYESIRPNQKASEDTNSSPGKNLSTLFRSPIPAIAAAVILVVAATFMFRAQVVRALPATSGLFSAIGYPVNLRGLELKNVRFEQDFENGAPVLSIHGEVVNITDTRVPIPKLRFALRNEQAQEVYYWSGAVDQESLESGGTIPFTTRLSSPPVTARDIMIRFTDRVSG